MKFNSACWSIFSILFTSNILKAVLWNVVQFWYLCCYLQFKSDVSKYKNEAIHEHSHILFLNFSLDQNTKKRKKKKRKRKKTRKLKSYLIYIYKFDKQRIVKWNINLWGEKLETDCLPRLFYWQNLERSLWSHESHFVTKIDEDSTRVHQVWSQTCVSGQNILNNIFSVL